MPCVTAWTPALGPQSPRPPIIAFVTVPWKCPFESMSPTTLWPLEGKAGHSGACCVPRAQRVCGT